FNLTGQPPHEIYTHSLHDALPISPEEQKLANEMRLHLSTYEENYELIQIGAYKKGTNPQVDRAIQLQPKIISFLKQAIDEKSTRDEAIALIKDVLSGG